MTGHGVKFSASGRGGRSLHVFAAVDRDRNRQNSARDNAWDGVWPQPFSDNVAIDRYLNTDPLPCLLCGRSFKRLGVHLGKAHNVLVREYVERLGLPRGNSGRNGRGCLASVSESAKCADRLVKRRDYLAFLAKGKSSARRPTITTGLSKYQEVALLSRVSESGRARSCRICGALFVASHAKSSKKFCGRECANSWRGQENRRRAHTRRCSGILPKTVSCSDCAGDLPKGSSQALRCVQCNLKWKRAQSERSERWVTGRRLWEEGKTQREIAEAIGISQGSVAEYVTRHGWSR